jgi:hypothetical protein
VINFECIGGCGKKVAFPESYDPCGMIGGIVCNECSILLGDELELGKEFAFLRKGFLEAMVKNRTA